ncbi:MAG: Stp1/IreP family PP2C-type Ser/Thr phosphatase [Gemmatimonadetes bacterium]|nr:Stp1/IreP family PP2C-type Ser/Thr phosphatase [Gemmatimonadota bacterium]
MVRSGNEDNFFAEADERRGIFVVADGMGGHAAGEVASEMAVQIVSRQLLTLEDIRDAEADARMTQCLVDANRTIYDRMLAEVDKQGMGTTASVLAMFDSEYMIGQVGDSRIYMLRDGALSQVTKDHSYVQEQVDAGLLTPEQARYHPYSNVITRCVGANETVDVDIFRGVVMPGDVFLVASDGLTGMVDDRRLQQILLARSSPGRIVDALIAEANGRGGLDNITAIVVQVGAVDAPEPAG